MVDVAYAGPYPEPAAAPDPTPLSPPDATAARPVATVKANEVPVRVVSDQPHVGLHVRAGQSHGVGTTWLAGTPGGMGITAITAQHYNDLCTAPCELSMAVGEYRFGVSQGGGRVQETGEPVRLRGPATLHVEYESRAAYRVVGWTLVAASAVAGTYLFAEGSRLRYDEKQVGTYSDGSPRTERVERPKQEAMVWSGVAIGVVGVTVGLVLALLQDHAEVTVESPKTAPGPRARLVADGIAGEF